MLLYVTTANRGAQWQDSGYFILRAVTGEAVNPLGLALTHPLHYWISRFIVRLNLVEPSFGVTLISSVSAAVAVANIFGCAMALTDSRRVALLVAASLALANTFWQLATIAETYTLSAALMSAQCWCVIALVKPALDRQKPNGGQPSTDMQQRDRWLFLGFWLLNGISLANHNLALLTLPMLLAATLWAHARRIVSYRTITLAAVLWLVGASLYLWLVMEEGFRSGDWPATIRSALFGHHFQDRVLNASMSGQLSAIAAGFVLLNFPNLFLAAAVVGLCTGWKQHQYSWLYRLLFLGLIVHALFAFRYPVSDQHYFFLPTFIFMSFYAALGFHGWIDKPDQSRGDTSNLLNRRRLYLRTIAWLLLAATPFVYAAVPGVLRRWDTLAFFSRNKPYRDDYRYLFLPWSVAEGSAQRMSTEAVRMAGDSGVIVVEDKMAAFAVKYQVVLSGKSSVQVLEDLDPATFNEASTTGRRVVLVPADVNRVLTHPIRGSWRRVGDLYVLEEN